MLYTKFDNFTTPAKLAFVLNNKVEKVTEMPKGLVYMFLESESISDLTEEVRASTGNDKYFVIELHGSGYNPHRITCDEGMYSMVLSNPTYVEIPEELDVQVGWSYDGTTFLN
jgi:hypothetical protein